MSLKTFIGTSANASTKTANRPNPLYRKQMMVGYMLLVPALILFAVFFGFALFESIRYSLLDWDGVGKQSFIGLNNYVEMLRDSVFWKSFFNNWAYALGIVVLGVFPGLLLAYLLSLPGIRGRTFFRTVYFFPRIVSAVIYGVVWKWIYDPRNGLLLMLLDALGIDASNFAMLGNPKTAMIGIIITGGWTYFGFCMVIFLAALMGNDTQLKESALIDGANKFQIFFKIVLPQIAPVFNALIIFTIIDSFKVYDLVLVLTAGGPNDATQIMTYYIFKQAFTFDRFGYGSATAIMLGIFMVIFTVVYNRFLNKEEA
ncbi:sugar ABC transporter permease [Paenibacillus sp.]|uniref:carbohydrate ABC transporter permease n=1 Tax=Paenibacillus sp. TaxID=58172 RepID=UPI002D4A8C20|nr:sugar ABC transporter permease [Paenibacillus sp.]HZG86019.1 sugar ABC transporter permease [Paenibacillus sp.]